MNIGLMHGLAPQFYDSKDGKMFFSIPYGQRRDKEQILEQILHNSSINPNLLDICQVPIFIYSSIGSIYKIKSIKSTRKDRFYNIEDTLDFETPNIVRSLLRVVLSKNKKLVSYEDLKVSTIKSTPLVEDYCKKDSSGLFVQLPTNNSWMKLKAEDIRRLTMSNIEYGTLFNGYEQVLIHPILQSVWAS
jgi:hypothetical protein